MADVQRQVRNGLLLCAAGLLFLLAMLPTAWVVLGIVATFDGAVHGEKYDGKWFVINVAWWIGFAATIAVTVRLARRQARLLTPLILVGLVIGALDQMWLEFELAYDIKRIFPPGFFAAPHLLLLLGAACLRARSAGIRVAGK
jgi:hypothetical protein